VQESSRLHHLERAPGAKKELRINKYTKEIFERKSKFHVFVRAIEKCISLIS